MKYQQNVVKKTPRGTKDRKVVVDLKVNDIVVGNGLDNIYIFTDRTYGNEYVLP